MGKPLFDYKDLDIAGIRYDDLGPLLVLNDLWAREPERFGADEAARTALQKDIRHLLGSNIGNNRFLPSREIAQCFTDHGINPLEGVSIINVSPQDVHAIKWRPLTQMCGEGNYITIAEASNLQSPYLKTTNAAEMAGNRKVDYVITGNVLNYQCNTDPADTIRATAMMLKKGGRAIHLLDMEGTPEHSEKVISNRFEDYTLAGQKFLGFLPEGLSVDSYGLMACVAEQSQEIAYAPPSNGLPSADASAQDKGIASTAKTPDGQAK